MHRVGHYEAACISVMLSPRNNMRPEWERGRGRRGRRRGRGGRRGEGKGRGRDKGKGEEEEGDIKREEWKSSGADPLQN